jgi:hypothetical protein
MITPIVAYVGAIVGFMIVVAIVVNRFSEKG